MTIMINEKEKCFFSIIICAYNEENHLAKSLNSILKQTFRNFEVIIVDDGSTDRTIQICRHYHNKDNRVCYYQRSNHGLFQSRIYGVSRSIGKYIMFCDADDYYVSKNAFDYIYCILNEKTCDMLQFGYYNKYHLLKSNKTNYNEELVDRDIFKFRDYPKLLCSYWEESKLNNPVWNKVYSKKLFQNVTDEVKQQRFFWGEDQILNLFLLEKCEKVYFCSKPLYCYLSVDGGTKKWRKETMYDLDTIKKYQLMFVEKCNSKERKLYERVLFAELAAWFLLFLESSIPVLTRSEIIDYVNEILDLPRFQIARNYYLSENDEKWEAVDLLRKADAEQYYIAARSNYFKNKKKNAIKKLAKKII